MNLLCRSRMMFRSSLLLLFMLVALGAAPGGASTQQPKKKTDENGITYPPEDVNLLSMEVNALRTLYLLRGTAPDLAVGSQHPETRLTAIKSSKKLAECAQKGRKREKADVSKDYHQTLIQLRAALIAQDDANIEKFDKQLQDLQKAEEPDLDDGIEITAEARKEASSFVKVYCAADQVVAYIASYGKDLPNPRHLLFTALRVTDKNKGATFGTKATPEEWKALRKFTIREVSWQVAGLNVAKGDDIAARLGELLDKAYAMSEEELKENSLMLRTEARKITDLVGPTDLLRFIIERDAAELLSNPQLMPAIQARLRYLDAKKKS